MVEEPGGQDITSGGIAPEREGIVSGDITPDVEQKIKVVVDSELTERFESAMKQLAEEQGVKPEPRKGPPPYQVLYVAFFMLISTILILFYLKVFALPINVGTLGTGTNLITVNPKSIGVIYEGQVVETNYGKIFNGSYNQNAQYKQTGVSAYLLNSSFFKTNNSTSDLYYNGQYYIIYTKQQNSVGRICLISNSSLATCLNQTYGNVSAVSLFYNASPSDYLIYIYKLAMRDFLIHATTQPFGIPAPAIVGISQTYYNGQACRFMVETVAGSFGVVQNLGITPATQRTVQLNITITGCISNLYNVPLNATLNGTAAFTDPSVAKTIGYSKTRFNISVGSSYITSNAVNVSKKISGIQSLINSIH